MIRYFLAAAVTALPCTAGALDQTTCRDSWQFVRSILPQDSARASMPQIVRFEDSWCVINGVSLAFDRVTRMEIGQLRWQGVGLEAFVKDQTPPTSLSVRAKNLRVIATPGDPVLDYLLRAQAARNGIEASFGANWDPATKRLDLTGLTLDFPGENSVQVAGAVDRIDLSSQDAILLSLGGTALRALRIDVVSNGLFENTVLMALGGALLDRTDPPEKQVERLKADAVTWINSLPDSLVDAPSKAAMARLASDMPNPNGTMTLELLAPDGFVLARLMRFAAPNPPETVEEIAAVLDGLKIGYVYE